MAAGSRGDGGGGGGSCLQPWCLASYHPGLKPEPHSPGEGGGKLTLLLPPAGFSSEAAEDTNPGWRPRGRAAALCLSPPSLPRRKATGGHT